MLRKFINLEPELEMMACKESLLKTKLVIDEMLYSFKNEEIVLSHNNSVVLSALYYTIVEVDKLQFLNRVNFKETCLESLLPDSMTCFNVAETINSLAGTTKPSFLDEVYMEVLRIRDQTKPTIYNL